MKHIIIALMAVLLLAGMVAAQSHGHGSGLKTGGTQGVVSGMMGGPHDFTKTNYTGDTTTRAYKGASNSLCGYCHAIHIPAEGIPAPLWSRASVVGNANGGTYGVYSSVSLDATPAEVSASDNYSSFCLSCHDGSAMFAGSKYTKTPYVSGGWPGSTGTPTFATDSVGFAANFGRFGEYGGLSHVHPVNFNYASAAAVDQGLYPAPAAGTDYMYWDATYGAVGRLFGGTMQCSSCHNPHNNSKGILLQGSSNYGALCVSCHKK